MRVRIYSGIDFEDWRRAGLSGERPGLAPYGLEHLAAAGLSLVPRQPPRWLRGRARTRIVKGVEWRLLPLVQPLQLLHGADDIALAVLEREGVTHALLRRAGVPPWSRVPLVLVSCWIADEVRHASPARMAVLRALVQGADLIVYWSRNQGPIFRDVLGVEEERLFFVPFGIENDFYTPAAPDTGERFVLSVGRDRGRDWKTLVEAVNGLAVPVRLVCPADAVRRRELAPHVELVGEVDQVSVRALLRRAAVVALALDPDVAYPTGQTVLLSAMAVGTATVVTDSAAMHDYARHGENTWVVAPRDPVALRAGIETVLLDPALAGRLSTAALADVRERFNAAAMWRTIGVRIRELGAPVT